MISYIQFNVAVYLGEVTDKGTFTRFETAEGLIFDIENGVLYTEMQLGNFAFMNIPNNGAFGAAVEDFSNQEIATLDNVGNPEVFKLDNSAGIAGEEHNYNENGNLTIWHAAFDSPDEAIDCTFKKVDFGAADSVGHYYAVKCNAGLAPATTTTLQFTNV